MTENLQTLRNVTFLLDTDRFDVVLATGQDRAGFLHRVTTGNIQGTPAGEGAPTLLLETKSQIRFVTWAFIQETSVRLLVPTGQGAGLADGLAKYAIMDDCTFRPDASEAWVTVLGPAAVAVLERLGISVVSVLASKPALSHATIEHAIWGRLWVARVIEMGTEGFWIAMAPSEKPRLLEALQGQGLLPLPPELAEAFRILALEPRLGTEIAPGRFPVEVGLGRAIDHKKGCYVGQETTVRMRDRGNCRRRMVLLRLVGSDLPRPGDIFDAPGRITAGQITSVTAVPGEAPAALALAATSVPTGVTVSIHHDDRLLEAVMVAESKPWG